MLPKERLDIILMPVEKLLRRGAPWVEVVDAGVKASEEIQTLPYEMPRLKPDPAELELPGESS